MPGGAPHSQASGTAERPAGALKGALRRVLLNSARLLGGKSVSAVFGLGYVALAARGLGLEGYGTLILIHTFTAVVSRIFSFKSWQTLLRYGTPLLQRGDASRRCSMPARPRWRPWWPPAAPGWSGPCSAGRRR